MMKPSHSEQKPHAVDLGLELLYATEDMVRLCNGTLSTGMSDNSLSLAVMRRYSEAAHAVRVANGIPDDLTSVMLRRRAEVARRDG